MKQEEFDALVEKMETAIGGKIDQSVKDALKGMDAAKLKAIQDMDIDGLATKEDLKDLFDGEAFKTFRTQLNDIEETVNQLKDQNGPSGSAKTMTQAVEENKEAIKGLVMGTSSKEVVLKADTVRASIANNTNSYHLPDIGQLGVKERSLYNIFPKVPVTAGDHNGTVSYIDWDEATTVRAAEMAAEGAVFAESTAKFEKYTLPLKKVGDSLPVSEEFGEDAPAAAAELEMFLDVNVNTKIDDQIANGDGSGQNLTGLIPSVPVYTAANEGITGANIYDLARRVRTDIVKNRGSKYRPDFVAMNADTLDSLHLEKDANNNYIFKNDDSSIGSLVIVEDNNIPDNQMVVGDRRYARIYEMAGVAISRGLKGDQFVEDMETIKARKRLLFLIREVDKTGFRKVTDISTALTALAT